MLCYTKLNNHALLKYLDEQEFQAIQNIAKIENYANDQIIISIGERNRDILFIKSGNVQVSVNLKGKIINVTKLNQGEFFGEMNFILPLRRTANIKSNGDSVIHRYPYSELCAFLKNHNLIAAKIFCAINEFQASKLIDTLNQI
jgi:CRP-like cAMP-binding protein